jgi:hypothetical protein
MTEELSAHVATFRADTMFTNEWATSSRRGRWNAPSGRPGPKWRTRRTVTGSFGSCGPSADQTISKRVKVQVTALQGLDVVIEVEQVRLTGSDAVYPTVDVAAV